MKPLRKLLRFLNLPVFAQNEAGSAQIIALVMGVSGVLLAGLYELQERNNKGAKAAQTNDGRDAALRANLSAIAYFQAQMRFAQGASFQDLTSGVGTMPAIYPSPYFASKGGSASLAATGAGHQSGSVGQWRLAAPNAISVTLPTAGKFSVSDFPNLMAGKPLAASAPSTTTITIGKVIKGNPAAPEVTTAFDVVATTENLVAEKMGLDGLKLVSTSARVAVGKPPRPYCVIDAPPLASAGQAVDVTARIYGIATQASFPSTAADVSRGAPPYSGGKDLRSIASSIGPAKTMSFRVEAPSPPPSYDSTPVSYPIQFVLTGVEPTSTYTCSSQLSVSPPKPPMPPGTLATRVGINFEDGGGADTDYNDGVFCFVGEFIVDGTNVISRRRQRVTLATFANSDCDQTLTATVVNPHGPQAPSVKVNAKLNQTVTLFFEEGSRLEVSLTPSGANCKGDVRSMHNSSYAVVAPNKCNN